MPGLPPKPTQQMKLSGSWRLAGRKKEPTLPLLLPKPPPWLSDDALACWNDLIAYIAPMRVLTAADGLALAQLAEYYARWKKATEAIAKVGEVVPVRDAAGNTIGFKRNPFVAMQLEYGLMMRRMMQEFGLTPSARARLVAPNETAQVEAIFSRKASALQ